MGWEGLEELKHGVEVGSMGGGKGLLTKLGGCLPPPVGQKRGGGAVVPVSRQVGLQRLRKTLWQHRQLAACTFFS